jgi:hypothetical protein
MMEFDLAVAARFRKSGGGHRQVRKKRRLIKVDYPKFFLSQDADT